MDLVVIGLYETADTRTFYFKIH